MPPGSIGPRCTRNLRSDDKFYVKLQQKYGPIFKLFWGGQNLRICLVGFDRGRRFMAQHKGILKTSVTASASANDISSVVPHGYLRVMRGETHARYRRAFVKALSDDLITARTDEYRDTIRGELTRLAKSDSASDPALSLVEALNQICTRTLMSLVYGVGAKDRTADELYRLYCKLGPRGYLEDVIKKQQAEAYSGIRIRVSQILSALQSDEIDEYSDCVLKRLIIANPESELDETFVGNAIYLVERGRHDVRDLLRWVLKHLSDNPSVVASVRSDLGTERDTLLSAQACVMESLRLEQAEVINRTVTTPISFEGYDFPKNTHVGILIRESHRDPAVFDEPDSYRPKRFVDRVFSANEYSPFGLDAHRCIASSFVVHFGTIFVEELVKSFQWEVIDDGPPHRGHFHWQPSQKFSIRLIQTSATAPGFQ